MNAFSGTARWSFGEPCCAECAERAQDNPPADDFEPGTAFGLDDFLAQSLAIGVLADTLGLPDGQKLAASVGAFVRDHGDEAASVETSGLLGAAARGLTGRAAAFGSKVEQKAIQLFGVAERHPNLLFAAGAVGVGALYLSGQAQTRAVEISNQRALVSEQLSRVSPQEAVKALQSLNLMGAASGGLGVFGWLGLGAGVLALILAWRAFR